MTNQSAAISAVVIKKSGLEEYQSNEIKVVPQRFERLSQTKPVLTPDVIRIKWRGFLVGNHALKVGFKPGIHACHPYCLE